MSIEEYLSQPINERLEIVNSKRINLGYFENEYEAHLAYENKLKSIL